ncbi:MAG: radical SAM protein [Pirellulaceae bacterium]
MSLPRYADRQILAVRGPKNSVDLRQPYAFLVEPECSASGLVEDVATLFLTNRECPFRCLMCDLWRNTTDTRVPPGTIPQQIDYALARLPATRHIKLYNSGNFFDHQAIPPEDYATIAHRLRTFETIIVENHPRLCGDDCLRFRDLVNGQLEIALGLETVHEQVLERLNKRMTLRDYERAVRFLHDHGMRVRTFILLRPPYEDEQQGVEWALRSLQFAFDLGVQCCAIIPTRAGNGMLDQLERNGLFASPRMSSMERVLDAGLAMQRGRVLMDLWDCERFYPCGRCGPLRRARLHAMNLSQSVLPTVMCDCQTPS